MPIPPPLFSGDENLAAVFCALTWTLLSFGWLMSDISFHSLYLALSSRLPQKDTPLTCELYFPQEKHTARPTHAHYPVEQLPLWMIADLGGLKRKKKCTVKAGMCVSETCQ